MPWGKLDDEFDDNPKVMRLLDEESELEGPAAVGLWTLALAWANRNTRKPRKTPGRLPATLPRHKLGPAGVRLARILVKHELWDEIEDAKGGWMIHDFHEYLPDEATREKKSAAGKKGADARWGPYRAQKAAAAAAAAAAKTAGSDGTVPSENGTVLSGDGTSHAVPYGKPGVTSPAMLSQSAGGAETDGTVPSGHGTVPSHEQSGSSRGNGSDQGFLAEVVTIDGTLPLVVSKTAPHTHSHTQEKNSSSTDVEGVTLLPATTTANGRRRYEYTPEFEEFWKAYGGKGAKRTAAAEWHRALTRAPREVIMAAVGPYVESRPNPRYRKDAERWLKGDCWLSAVVPHTDPAPGRGVPFRNPVDRSLYAEAVQGF